MNLQQRQFVTDVKDLTCVFVFVSESELNRERGDGQTLELTHGGIKPVEAKLNKFIKL